MIPIPDPPATAPGDACAARTAPRSRSPGPRLAARRVAAAGACAGLALLLQACQSYVPKPLPRQAAWPQDPAALTVHPRAIALPRLAAQRIDLSGPLDMDAVAALAVLNNPQLRLARDRSGIARAQAFAAGLLPDPTFSASRDYPGNSAGATSTAYSATLGFDLGRLITLPAARAAAREHVRAVHLQMLWQEWQTAAQAQLLYVGLVGLRQRDQILNAEHALVGDRLQRERAAARAGDLPRTTADADLVALQQLQQRLAADARQRVARQAQLDALLGLDPAATLPLGAMPVATPAGIAQVHRALDRLGDIRPDLMALRAGYASQEQKLREAVLAQFPDVSVGFRRARDTTSVNTVGFGVSFSLPIFNGSRGAIAVQRASRKALYDAYRLRLAQSRADVEQALRNLALLSAQQQSLRAALPALQAASKAAAAALHAGDIPLVQAQQQRAALLEQRLALQANAQQMAEQAVALDLLTGAGIYRPVANARHAGQPSQDRSPNP